ncbi:metal ABC transporter ATP-binding protein [Enterococcus sp. BWB1-3]|uniref:metal ABC transporter ATP-binding protein n=1 Tax=Enterococcus sp. BWB1-3 TaxID=2787713 RepID=UPI001921327A|nr:metal ABC transporter ATP-binding protein [Enterococcus sp. BWB1-3]MBL1229816.1 metal ABC transporter ATP-binding protein [Enterococcus sp. BWB1-3]
MDNNLSINHLTISYKRKIAVQIENLIITKNQLTGIIGPNGAGKSTLLKGMLGLIPINRGEVVYKNQPVSRQLNKFAYVEQRQEIDLSFPIDVFGVVLLGTYPKIGLIKRPGKKEKELAWSCLEKVGMADFAHNQIGELSGGQLQRVFIARALAQEAEWIFLDEPFVGIDATSEKIIIDLLKQLRDEGKSIVIVHHDLHKVRDYFDQLVLLNKQVIAFGSVDQVFEVDNMKKTYGEEIAEMLKLGGK